MKKRKLKIWLSATDLLPRDLGQIISFLPNYEIIYNQDLINKAGARFSLENHLSKLEKCDLFVGLINPKK